MVRESRFSWNETDMIEFPYLLVDELSADDMSLLDDEQFDESILPEPVDEETIDDPPLHEQMQWSVANAAGVATATISPIEPTPEERETMSTEPAPKTIPAKPREKGSRHLAGADWTSIAWSRKAKQNHKETPAASS